MDHFLENQLEPKRKNQNIGLKKRILVLGKPNINQEEERKIIHIKPRPLSRKLNKVQEKKIKTWFQKKNQT